MRMGKRVREKVGVMNGKKGKWGGGVGVGKEWGGGKRCLREMVLWGRK